MTNVLQGDPSVPVRPPWCWTCWGRSRRRWWSARLTGRWSTAGQWGERTRPSPSLRSPSPGATPARAPGLPSLYLRGKVSPAQADPGTTRKIKHQKQSEIEIGRQRRFSWKMFVCDWTVSCDNHGVFPLNFHQSFSFPCKVWHYNCHYSSDWIVRLISE